VADEIKQKIVLEGEKEYSAALKEANRNLKTLKSALKAESAELGSNASAQQKNEVKARTLKKQIAEQEKVVATLQSALKEVKDKYGDNADAVAKWEQKLNDARYDLANFNNELQKAESELANSKDSLKDSADAYGDAADAATDYANATDAAGQVADAVTFQSVMNAADNLKDRLVGAMNTIKELGKTAWDWMSDSGAWADELQTLSDQTGIDKQTLQGWRYASRFVDVEVETITKAYAKLTNRSKSVNKALKEIGIKADAGVDAGTVFWEVIEAMEEMDDVARENTAKEFFGKSYQELMPLIKAGREGWEGYIKEAQDAGYILSDEQVARLSQFDDARQQLEASFESLKLQVAEQLAPAFEKVAQALTDIVDKFIAWGKTEEGQAALKGLGEAIESIITSLTGDIDFNKIVGDAQKAIEGFTGALDWISKNWETVKAGVLGIGGVIGGLSVAKDVLSALQLIKGIRWSTLPKAPSVPTGPVASSPTTTPGAPGGGSILPYVGVAAGATVLVNEVAKAQSADAMEELAEKTGIKKAMEALGFDTEAEKVLNEVNKANGINTFGDVEDKIANTPQEKNQEAMRFMFNSLFGGNKPAPEPKPEIRPEDSQLLTGDENLLQGTLEEIRAAQATVEQAQAEAQAAREVSATPEMRQAAEQYWDALRSWKNGEPGSEFALEDAFDALDAAFAGQEEELANLNTLMDKLQGDTDWVSTEDLPDWWFTGPESLTSTDIQGFVALPEQMEAAVARGAASGVNGLTITMDGYTVARIVAPLVSQMIAENM